MSAKNKSVSPVDSPEPKSDETGVLLKRLLSYVWPFWYLLAAGLLATMLFSSVDAAAIYYLKPLMNKGFIERDNIFIRWVPIVVVIAFLMRGVANISSIYCMTSVARTVVMKLRQQIFQHLLKLPALFYDKTASGKILSKLLYDVEQVAQVSTNALTTFVQAACIAIGLLLVMFVISWRLSLLFFTTIPVMMLVVKVTNRRIRKISYQAQKTMGKVTEIASESIEGYRAVRTYGGQDYETNKFIAATNASRRCDMKVAITKAYAISGVQITAALSIAFIIYLAITPGQMTALTAGDFASFTVAMVALLKPLKNLSRVTGDIQKGLAGASSIFDLLDLSMETDEGKQALTKSNGVLEYRNVSFNYDSEETKVLHDINFTVEAGQTVAIVGRSGSGKSTLVSLLARFYELEQGKIILDGFDIRDLSLQDLRKQLAIVSQQLTLFNGSIAENIAYGYSDKVNEVDIKQAAIASHAMEFIEKLPEGMQTLVGENGVLLSGGQRQRIALARAILKDAPVLILDEATSALDTESERYIQSALDKVMRSRTTLVIAHRLSTIENADKIIVLDNGRLVEEGTHKALLQQKGYYAKLHAMQLQNSEAEQQLTAEALVPA